MVYMLYDEKRRTHTTDKKEVHSSLRWVIMKLYFPKLRLLAKVLVVDGAVVVVVFWSGTT